MEQMTQTITLNGTEYTVYPLPLVRVGEVISTLSKAAQDANIGENMSEGQMITQFAQLLADNMDDYAPLVSNLMNNDNVDAEHVKNAKIYEIFDILQAILDVNEWDKIRSRFLSVRQTLAGTEESKA